MPLADDQNQPATDAADEHQADRIIAAASDAEPVNGDFPLAEAGKYYDGMWSGTPHYQCPYCPWNVLSKKGKEDGDGRVEIHILSRYDQGDPRHRRALEQETGSEGGKA